ncbi:hypothetical protein [Sinimarinibacterium flocculans]|uniref:hypothetical protein n=1 Tax=Sinimarinibacterium flocculans TaxID=985250 RepID=UPI0035152F86
MSFSVSADRGAKTSSYDWISSFFPSRQTDSLENSLNESRLSKLKKEFTDRFLRAVHNSPTEIGILGPIDELIAEGIRTNAAVTMQWLGEMYLENFAKPAVATELLLAVGRLSYSVAKPAGVTMAISALSHKCVEVQEAGVRAFEEWGSPESIEILENTKVSAPWLQNYILEVVKGIQREACLS